MAIEGQLDRQRPEHASQVPGGGELWSDPAKWLDRQEWCVGRSRMDRCSSNNRPSDPTAGCRDIGNDIYL